MHTHVCECIYIYIHTCINYFLLYLYIYIYIDALWRSRARLKRVHGSCTDSSLGYGSAPHSSVRRSKLPRVFHFSNPDERNTLQFLQTIFEEPHPCSKSPRPIFFPVFDNSDAGGLRFESQAGRVRPPEHHAEHSIRTIIFII